VRLAIFGGTFDPPHVGHLIVAQDAIDALHLDRLVFVPASIPPHKRDVAVTPAATRLDMLHAAVAGNDMFRIDEIEIRRGGPSFTVDTLREYRERLPDVELYLLIGTDQWAEFETWRDPGTIRQLSRVAVLAREGVAPAGAADVEMVPVTRVDISSTDIRRRVAAGRPIRYLVPEAVASIIERTGLYRERNAAGSIRAGQRRTGEGSAG